MDQLFAPWRIEWVEREGPADAETCVFCELPGRNADREALIVAESEGGYVLLNNYPYSPGHALVVPRRHTREFRELSGEELLIQGRLTQRTIDALETAMNPDGFNTGMNLGSAGGGSIGHLHTHVVPRWQGDTNFMAVIDETKVIVQALEDTYEALHEAFARQAGATVSGDDRAVHLELD